MAGAPLFYSLPRCSLYRWYNVNMNYSHYLFFASYMNDMDFLRFSLDARAIIDMAPEEALLCGDDNGPVVINDRMLIIGSQHNPSPFSRLRLSPLRDIPTRRYPVTVIKTDRTPYDPTIGALLLAFGHHFPAASITSDGTLADWSTAMAIYSLATDRDAIPPFK